MNTRQQNIRYRQDFSGVPVLFHADDTVLQHHALVQRVLAGEQGDLSLSLGDEGMGDVVVPVQDDLLLGVLIQKDVLFGRDILLHPLVDVQMVRG